jgi:hypothetical protein
VIAVDRSIGRIVIASAIRQDLSMRRRGIDAKPASPWRESWGIRLWILLRDQIDYAEFCRRAAPAAAR